MSNASVKLDELSRPPQTCQRRGSALPRLARWMAAAFSRLVGVMLVWAASLKVYDEAAVRRVLEFDGMPEGLLGLAVSIVIVVESALGLFLILRPRARGVLKAAIVLLALYTAQLAYLAAFHEAPHCVCLGAWKAYRAARLDNLLGVGRNVGLILGLLWVRAQYRWGLTRTSGTSPAST